MKVPRWIVPLLVLVAAAAGIGGARLFAAPSFTRDFGASEASVLPGASARPGTAARPAASVHPETVRMTVRGLKCVDTARAVAGQLEGIPGILRYAAYASRNEAQITYDPERISSQAIAEAIEGPVFVPGTGEILFHQYEVLSIRGGPIE
jgi:hypothetical protein